MKISNNDTYKEVDMYILLKAFLCTYLNFDRFELNKLQKEAYTLQLYREMLFFKSIVTPSILQGDDFGDIYRDCCVY